jgi:hypothetical protein
MFDKEYLISSSVTFVNTSCLISILQLNNNMTDEGQYGIVVNFSSQKFKGYTRAPYNFKLRKKYTVEIVRALRLSDSTEYKDSIQCTVNNGLIFFIVVMTNW